MANSYDVSERSPSPNRSCCGLFGSSKSSSKGAGGSSTKTGSKEAEDIPTNSNVKEKGGSPSSYITVASVHGVTPISTSPVKETVDSNSNSPVKETIDSNSNNPLKEAVDSNSNSPVKEAIDSNSPVKESVDSNSPIKEAVDSNSPETDVDSDSKTSVTELIIKPDTEKGLNVSPSVTIHVKEANVNHDTVCPENEVEVSSVEIADESKKTDTNSSPRNSEIPIDEPEENPDSKSNSRADLIKKDLTLVRTASLEVVKEVIQLGGKIRKIRHVSEGLEDCCDEDCDCGVPVEITDLLHEVAERWIEDLYSMEETRDSFHEHQTKEEMISLMEDLRKQLIQKQSELEHEIDHERHQVAQSSWRKIRSFLRWSPFVQVFKKHKYPWVQLSGHQGNFHAGEAGSVLKRLDQRELDCYQKLVEDETLSGFYPEFRGQKKKEDDHFIQLQDLLANFNSPCVMDVKMGVRTYLEDELHKARKCPTQRKDMYTKMIEIDANAPTSEEHERKSVTKPRYMQWRDEMSSSHMLGFRVEGIKKSDGHSSKDFKKTKSRDDVMEVLRSFTGESEVIVTKYINRLKEIMAAQESSQFFSSHEVVGSSLLFVHDAQEQVSVWMIDFGKTEKLPEKLQVDHRSPWVEGNHEDGYLYGLDHLVSIFEEVQTNLTSSPV